MADANRAGEGDRSRTLAEGRHLRFVERDGWEYVERPGVTGIAVLVAVSPAGALLLVEQYRPPVGAKVLELPAGLCGDEPGREAEPLEDAARRELLEETGWEAAKVERLASGPPSAGISSEIVTYFLASSLVRRSAGGGTAGESIRVHEVPLPGVPAWLAAREAEGLLVDPKVWAGLYFATMRERRSRPRG